MPNSVIKSPLNEIIKNINCYYIRLIISIKTFIIIKTYVFYDDNNNIIILQFFISFNVMIIICINDNYYYVIINHKLNGKLKENSRTI